MVVLFNEFIMDKYYATYKLTILQRFNYKQKRHIY